MECVEEHAVENVKMEVEGKGRTEVEDVETFNREREGKAET